MRETRSSGFDTPVNDKQTFDRLRDHVLSLQDNEDRRDTMVRALDVTNPVRTVDIYVASNYQQGKPVVHRKKYTLTYDTSKCPGYPPGHKYSGICVLQTECVQIWTPAYSGTW